MVRSATRIAAILLPLALVGLLSPKQSGAQDDRTKQLEQRVAQLERLVLLLQQRIAELESVVKGRQSQGQPVAARGNWREKSNWRGLRRGMPMNEVKEILGEPEKVETGSTLIFWHWGYPGGPSVHFDTDTGKLDGWSEP
jgi:hypothetical protein